MIRPNSYPVEDPQVATNERAVSPIEAVQASNRDVIGGIYAAAKEEVPLVVIQGTNTNAYTNHGGIIRLVYSGEREQAETNPYPLIVNPAVDKLSELVTNGRVIHSKVPGVYSSGFRPTGGDPLYEVIDRAWGPVYAFNDAESGQVICYSVKTATHTDAETVLVSPEHVNVPQTESV